MPSSKKPRAFGFSRSITTTKTILPIGNAVQRDGAVLAMKTQAVPKRMGSIDLRAIGAIGSFLGSGTNCRIGSCVGGSDVPSLSNPNKWKLRLVFASHVGSTKIDSSGIDTGILSFMSNTTPQTNLENLIELLIALGYSGSVTLTRSGTTPKYSIGWDIPESFGIPSGPTAEEAASNGIAMLMRRIRSHYVDCKRAIDSIERICGAELSE